MQSVMMLDLETSGLDPVKNQILEYGAVVVHNGAIVHSDHCYIDHPQITYDSQALKMFGDRIKDRRIGVRVLTVSDFRLYLLDTLRKLRNLYFGGDRLNIGGKNVGWFDAQFLKNTIPGFVQHVKHRFLDIGNLYAWPTDKYLPDMKECVERDRMVGGEILVEPNHTALDDAMCCAELYRNWTERRIAAYDRAKRWCKDAEPTCVRENALDRPEQV